MFDELIVRQLELICQLPRYRRGPAEEGVANVRVRYSQLRAVVSGTSCTARSYTIESGCTARPAEIRRHDLLHRFRLDVELPQTRQGPACHVIRLEQVNLAGRKRRAWQELE